MEYLSVAAEARDVQSADAGWIIVASAFCDDAISADVSVRGGEG